MLVLLRLFLFGLVLVAGPLSAACTGQNLITALSDADRAALQTAADAAPFAHGNLWHATKGDQHITLIGTFHLDDPRHVATVAALEPDLSKAGSLLVEAGPEEEAAMKAALAARPELLINPGPSLPETLAPADWARLSLALTARGIPPAFAARLQPWYVSTILALPVCKLAEMDSALGLDKRLIAAAQAKGVLVKALEPYDILFHLFDGFTPEDMTQMLLETLATTGPVENDMAVTLTDSYFAGDSRLFWEFTRDYSLSRPGADPVAVARQFDLVEQAMMTDRNRAWIGVIEGEAAKGPLVVAFGALHLAGEAGVLNLLQADGYTLTAW